MDEQKIIDDLTSQGYDKVWPYEAEPGEVDEEHEHDFDTHLVVLRGQISITSLIDGVVTNMSHSTGSNIFIARNTPHAAKVSAEGCRYIVAEKH
ncbi:MAG: hypothetical protein ABIT47_00790 [Candidatus Paceibacterota bacterium]